MTDETKFPLRRYTCQRGHKIEVRGTWTTFATSFHFANGEKEEHEFLFCQVCAGEWAQQQWPMTCEIVDDAPLSRDP